MTATATTKPTNIGEPLTTEHEFTAPAGGRRFAYPMVRAVAMPTAHPSREAWPLVDVSHEAGARAGAATDPRPRRPRGARPRRVLTLAKPARAIPAVRDDERVASRFDELQGRLPAVEAAARAGQQRSIVVVPSRTIDKSDEPPAVTQALEERLLCSVLELRDPRVRVTYVTSRAIASPIIDYYLSLLPRRTRAGARSRLNLVAVDDGSARPLSEKLLERPAVLERIRRAIGDEHPCHLAPYATTGLEREIAVALGIPMYGADPRHAYLGTKTGCRRLFAGAGVPHPAGSEGIMSVSGAIDAIAGLRRAKPGLMRLVMKLDDGVSGAGNAILDLAGLPEPGAPDEADGIARRLESLAPEAAGETAATYLAKLAQRGAIIEEWICGEELHSPSVQLRITPFGEVQLLSTHDQILGGPSGQSYLGCRFPAAPSYAPAISTLARRIGASLATEGVLGRFAIDFVVSRDEAGRWQPFAIELNLRKGGTTHPYETLAHLTGGAYHAESATFATPTGQPRHYVSTDHLQSPALRELGFHCVLDLAHREDLRFHPMRRTGAVFHMLSSIDEVGRTGFTAIGDSADEAAALYDHVQATLLAQADATAGRAAPSRDRVPHGGYRVSALSAARA